jgi:hypothetical protein
MRYTVLSYSIPYFSIAKKDSGVGYLKYAQNIEKLLEDEKI